MITEAVEVDMRKIIKGTVTITVLACAVLAIVFRALVPIYRAHYSAESKKLTVTAPNGDVVELIGILNSTNTHPTFRLYNAGFLRQYQHEAVADFVTNVLVVAAMSPACDTNSALAVSEAFFRVANKRIATAIKDVEDFKKGRIHE